MELLLEYLQTLQTGPVTDIGQLEMLLFTHWSEFQGAEEEGMANYKLLGRMEDAHWVPPVLTFVIERHGGIVCGSSRAELQRWTVDMDTRNATCEQSGYRQLYQQQPRLDTRPIAQEIVSLIHGHHEDERLKWRNDGSVLVKISMIAGLEEWSACRQTLTERRRRFRGTVEQLLQQAGWRMLSMNRYAPPLS